MGEKGSLKNLYKSFRFFLANIKRKKKKEILEKKKNKTSIKLNDKFKLSFFIVLTSIFGFLISFFTSPKKEMRIVEEIKDENDLINVKRFVIEVANIIQNTKNIDTIKNCKTEINKTLEKVNKAGLSGITVSVVKKDLETADLKADKKIEIIKEDNLKQEEKKVLVIQKIEKLNDELKDTKKRVDQIKTKLPEVVLMNELEEIKELITKLEKRLKYDEFNDEDLKKLDQFLLLYNTEELRILKVKVDEKLKRVINENLKQDSISSTNIVIGTLETKKKNSSLEENIKETKTELEKKTEAKEKKRDLKEKKNFSNIEKIEQIDNDLIADLKMTTSIVNKQIIAMEYKANEILKIRQNKPLFFIKIRHAVSNTLRFCAGISPFFFFRNKVVGGFTSSILLNNSIRSMRRSISNERKTISYIKTNGLELLIKEHSEIEKRTKDIFDDSFRQLAFFKSDFIKKYGLYIDSNIELTNMMKEINSIEEYIVTKQDEFKKENDNIKIKMKRF